MTRLHSGKSFLLHTCSRDSHQSQRDCGPLPDAVRPLITERDLCCTDDPLDPTIKLLDWDSQWLIRQEAQDHLRTLLALLVPLAQAGWQVVEPPSPPKHLNRLQEKESTSARRWLHKPSTGSLLPVLQAV